MGKTEKKKISIIVPVYNVQMYLQECLDSVLGQAFDDYEVICINDGSTDDSLLILESYAQKDERIKIVTTENKGLSAARNLGMELATGEYICFLDSDDMLEIDALDRMCRGVSEQHIDMLIFDAKVIYSSEGIKNANNISAYFFRKGDEIKISKGSEVFCELIERNEYIVSACLMLVKKSFIEKENIRFYEGMLYEDVLYSAQCYLLAKKVKYVKDINYVYRIREDSITTSPVTWANIRSRLICYDQMLGLLYTMDVNDRVRWALKKYISTFVDEIKHDKYLVQINEDFENQLSVRESLHLYAMGVDSCNLDYEYRIYRSGFEELIRNSECIYIYGAGKVGSKIYHYIKNMGMQNKVKSFITTSNIENGEYMQVPVVSIHNAQNTMIKKGLIVVAVRKKYQNEIINMLKNLELNNYLVINDKLESILDQLECF